MDRYAQMMAVGGNTVAAPTARASAAGFSNPAVIPGYQAQRGPVAPTAADFNRSGPWSSSGGGVGIANARDARRIAGAGWGTSGGIGASGGTLPNGGIYSNQFGTLGNGGPGGVVGAAGYNVGNGTFGGGGVGGIGGPGGGGLGGGGYGGAGGSYSPQQFGNTLQGAQDKANAANEGRYNQLLGLATNLSDAQMQRENIRANNLGQKVTQNAISAGIGNTTILPTLLRGVTDDSAIRQNEISDQGLRTQMGIIERRTDQQPNLGLAASVASRPGASGQFGGGYGSINPLSGGYGGGGRPAGAGYGSLANLFAGGSGGNENANNYVGYQDSSGFTNNSGPSNPNALALSAQARAAALLGQQQRRQQTDSQAAADPTGNMDVYIDQYGNLVDPFAGQDPYSLLM